MSSSVYINGIIPHLHVYRILSHPSEKIANCAALMLLVIPKCTGL